MSDLDDICTAMARQLGRIVGLNAADQWPDAIDPPMAIVDGPTNGNYELTFGGDSAEYTFEVTVIVEISALRGLTTAQRELRPYLSARGEKSIKAALLRDSRLGGLVDAMWVRSFRTIGQIEVNDVPNRYAATLEVALRTPC